MSYSKNNGRNSIGDSVVTPDELQPASSLATTIGAAPAHLLSVDAKHSANNASISTSAVSNSPLETSPILGSLQNGSSHSSLLLHPTIFDRFESPVKASAADLLAPSLPADDEHLSSAAILDLDDMTANELCGDIAGTPQIFGLTEMDLIASNKENKNCIDEPPLLVSPPPTTSNTPPELASPTHSSHLQSIVMLSQKLHASKNCKPSSLQDNLHSNDKTKVSYGTSIVNSANVTTSWSNNYVSSGLACANQKNGSESQEVTDGVGSKSSSSHNSKNKLSQQTCSQPSGNESCKTVQKYKKGRNVGSGDGGEDSESDLEKEPTPKDKEDDSTSHESSSSSDDNQKKNKNFKRVCDAIPGESCITKPTGSLQTTQKHSPISASEDLFASEELSQEDPYQEGHSILPKHIPKGLSERKDATAKVSSECESSSSGFAPNSNSSSDEIVVVNYSNLKQRKKEFVISPTVERRRKGISEALMSSVSSACRQISFDADTDNPTGSSNVKPPEEVTILDSSADQSLEVIYQAGKSDSEKKSSSDKLPEVIGSQDINLFLSCDTQSIESQGSFLSPANTKTIDDSRDESSTSIEPHCDNVVRSLSFSNSFNEPEDSQVPGTTINPSQLASLLAESKVQEHSQAPNIDNLKSAPIIQSSSSSGSNSNESNRNISGDSSQISEEVTDHVHHKYTEHQSLIENSQVASSKQSPPSPVSDTHVTNEPEILAEDSFAKDVLSSASLPASESISKIHIAIPEISMNEASLSLTSQCSATIVAKASKTAEKNLDIQRMELENTSKSRPHALQESDPFDDSENVIQVKRNTFFKDPVEKQNSPDKSKAASVPSSESSKPSNKVSNNGESNSEVGLKSSSSVCSAMLDSNKTRKTSTPNAENLSQGVSPHISGAGDSFIERRENSDLNIANENAMSSETGLPERSNSSRSTLELESNYLCVDESFKSIEEVRAKGCIPKETFHIKLTVWEDPGSGNKVYTLLKGNDEELVVKNLTFSKIFKKDNSNNDRRCSDVSTITSSSSGYHADKSSSGSSIGRRTSLASHSTEQTVKPGRDSIDSVQILAQTKSTLDSKKNLDDDFFTPPINRVIRKASPKVGGSAALVDSSSGDETPKSTLGYSSFKAAAKAKRNKLLIKPTIIEEKEGVAGEEVPCEISEVSSASSPRISSITKEICEVKNSPKTGIVNKGLHYNTEKFFEDLSSATVDILKSVPLSEDEREMFLKDQTDMGALDVFEEQARMVINRMISTQLTPQTLVFAKYHDHYYSAIIESENPAGGWNIKYTLDGFQKYCPIEHILPIDLLPRGQKCFRRYQSESNSKTIVSIMVVIKGHAIVNNAVLHVATDHQQTYKLPHSHLSLHLSDAQRYVNAWKATQSIVKSGPELSLDNVVAGKRRRTPISPLPLTAAATSPSNKTRTIRKKKPDPVLDTSLTEAELTSVEGHSDSERPRKKLAVSSGSVGASPLVHARITDIIAEESPGESSEPDTKKTVRARSSRSKASLSPKSKKSSVVRKSEPIAAATIDETAADTCSDATTVASAKGRKARTKPANLSTTSVPEADNDENYKKDSVQSCPNKKKQITLNSEDDSHFDPPVKRRSSRNSESEADTYEELDESKFPGTRLSSDSTPRKRGRPPSTTLAPKKVAKLELNRVDDEDEVPTENPSAEVPVIETRLTARGSKARSTPNKPATPKASSSSSTVSKDVSSPVASPSATSASGRSCDTRGRKRRNTPVRLKPLMLSGEECASSSQASPLRGEALIEPSVDPRLGTIPSKGSSIFKGFIVLITDAGVKTSHKDAASDDSDWDDAPPPLNKRHLTEQLRAGGAKVITKFEEADLLRVRKATFRGSNSSSDCEDERQLILLCDRHCRTAKYIQCLAVGIPIVSHQWVITASDMNRSLPWQDYILPAGVNIVTGKLVEQSISIVKQGSSSQGTVRESPLLEGDVVFLASSSNPQFSLTWLPLLSNAAAEVKIVPNEQAPLGRILDRKTTLVLADESIPRQQLERAKQLGKPIVSSNWFIQSIILGYKLPCDYHPSFKHDYTQS